MTVEIRRSWSEPLRMAMIGLLSIAAVVGVHYLFDTTPRQASLDSHTVKELTNRLDDVSERENATAHKIEELERVVESLRRQIEQRAPSVQPPSSPPLNGVSDPTTVSPALESSGTNETLARCLAYVAKGEFDSNIHNRLLADVVAAYAVRGLSPEVNMALLSAIQQVNEIGVTHVIQEVNGLRAADGGLRLRTFLATTPRLTFDQKRRLQAELAKHGR